MSNTARPFRVGLVGTGYIADFHARAIAAAGVELAAVCDANAASAKSFAASSGAQAAYDSLDAMLAAQRLDAVHVLTPPDTHHALAQAALRAGVHVFVEKPICASREDADSLLATASERGLRIGVNHNFLYSAAYRRMRDAIRHGTLGPLDHVAVSHFFELAQIHHGPYDSWMLRNPGHPMLEIGPHLFAFVLDLVGVPEDLSVAVGRRLTLPGGGVVFRRWRIRATVGRTAVDINVDLAPGFAQRTLAVRGLTGTAIADLDANTCAIDRRTPLAVDLDRYRRSRSIASAMSRQARSTLSDYLFSRLKLRRRGNPYQASILDSVAAFYTALRADKPLDRRIDPAFGRDVVTWCERTIEAAGLRDVPAVGRRPRPAAVVRPTVLVLGGSGFIGRELIRQLVARGYGVRAMIRGSSVPLDEIGGESLGIVRGDARNAHDIASALDGIEYVYDLATSAGKTWSDYLRNVVEPARLVGEACLAAGVKRLIYTGTIDSFYAGAHAGTINDSTPLDPKIHRRNYYARAKAAAEALLRTMQRERALPLVVFRPGIVIGAGGNAFHWGVGRFTESVCEVWGEGENPLPLVLVSDVADALVRGIEKPGIEGRSYNLVDAPLLSAREYLRELEKQAGIRLTVLHRPIWRFYATDMAKWLVKVAVGHPDKNRVPSYRDWESRTQKAVFDCRRAREELGWSPAGDRRRMVEEGIGGALAAWLESVR